MIAGPPKRVKDGTLARAIGANLGGLQLLKGDESIIKIAHLALLVKTLILAYANKSYAYQDPNHN